MNNDRFQKQKGNLSKLWKNNGLFIINWIIKFKANIFNKLSTHRFENMNLTQF